MSGPALSEWIDGSVKPTIVGVYQRDHRAAASDPCDPRMCLWDGNCWRVGYYTRFAAGVSRITSVMQALPWRGLRDDPALCAPCDGHAS